ncbi:hypothetical protein B0T26DRAFT_748161 [Lasiosphaeria miniovina]|uniref:Uncharacterized protein n=1 Tax=Lasiosphaeria miniovina TaxID=1954250 RepID=A0AA40E7G1_9PEZI|nr:uncharacterized protein B0T26DRAFT_748161 [Lasiosphaeria miniovina]KAK0727867.1 hypothetical protein B0T26DRAFT_748161 [Lasiosphaeria miniovina]
MADTWDDNTDMDMYYSEEEDEVFEFFSPPKLEGIESFAAWHSALRNYMRKDGLLKHIDGSPAEPKAGPWQPIGRTPADDEAEGIISLIIDTISPKFNYLLRPRSSSRTPPTRMATEEDETEADLVTQMTSMDLGGAGGGDDSSATEEIDSKETEEADNDTTEDMEADLVDKVARLELDAGDDSESDPDMDMDMDMDMDIDDY